MLCRWLLTLCFMVQTITCCCGVPAIADAVGTLSGQHATPDHFQLAVSGAPLSSGQHVHHPCATTHNISLVQKSDELVAFGKTTTYQLPTGALFAGLHTSNSSDGATLQSAAFDVIIASGSTPIFLSLCTLRI